MKIYTLLIILLISLMAFPLQAQKDSTANDTLPSLDQLLNMKVQVKEELMNAPVSVAGQKNQIIQEAPSIISVITKEDIANYGARDISEILHMVPGFEFGLDVTGLTGLSFRGIWVHEGKALIMLNGVAINDLSYGNTNLIGTIPAASIERIEIIRGPGSVIYGGFAEVTVVNIVTHSGKNLNGGTASVNGGIFGNGGFSRGFNMSYGQSTKNSEISANIGYTNQPLSTRTYNDFFGNSMAMNQKNAYREYWYAIVKANYKGLNINYTRTVQNYSGQDGNTNIYPLYNNQVTEKYTNYTEAISLKKEIRLSSLVVLEPAIQVTHGDCITSALLPTSQSIGTYGLDGGTTMYRYTARLLSNWDFRRYGQLIFGGSYVRDQLNSADKNGNPGLQVGPNPGDTAYKAHTNMTSVMAEYTNKFDAFGVTFGSRYESTTFGNAFAPRAGLTYVYDRFNAKLLYGEGYRIPLPYEAYSRTIFYSGNLRPETSNTTELEMGYRFSSFLSARFNVFNIDIMNPIKYDGFSYRYINTGRIQSHGAEGEVALRYGHWGGYGNISLALPGAKSSDNLLTTDEKQFLGMPTWKLSAGIYYNIKKLQISPSITYLTKRQGQSQASARDSVLIQGNTTYPAVFLLNLSITYNNLIKNLDLRLTGTNLLDSKYALIQTYYGGHAPLPVYDRHISLTAIVRF